MFFAARQALIVFILTASLFFWARADGPVSSPATLNPAVQTILTQADDAYSNRSDSSRARLALELYEKACLDNSASVEARWKTAQAAWWVAEQTESSKEKISIYEAGMKLANEAIALDPNSAEAHFWLGTLQGSYGEVRGVLKSLFLVKPIRREMETVLKLNPSYDGGAASRVLGVVDYKVPGFAGGDKKRALERLDTAFALDPRNPFNVYYLAEYYSIVGKVDKEREYLKQLRELTAPVSMLPDLVMMQKKGDALSKKIK